MRYWKGVYDENSERDLELRTQTGMPSDQDETCQMWLFGALVALQVLLTTLAGLLFVTER